MRSFTTQFRFRISPGATADGFTFCIQGGEPTAVGGPAGRPRLPRHPEKRGRQVRPVGNDGEGPNSTGLFLNGDSPRTPTPST